jgi:hypothetical protein
VRRAWDDPCPRCQHRLVLHRDIHGTTGPWCVAFDVETAKYCGCTRAPDETDAEQAAREVAEHA